MGKNKKYERNFETLEHPLEWGILFFQTAPKQQSKKYTG
jgi:hypothetical protein